MQVRHLRPKGESVCRFRGSGQNGGGLTLPVLQERGFAEDITHLGMGPINDVLAGFAVAATLAHFGRRRRDAGIRGTQPRSATDAAGMSRDGPRLSGGPGGCPASAGLSEAGCDDRSAPASAASWEMTGWFE